MDKTKEQLEEIIRVEEIVKKERECSDGRYAFKDIFNLVKMIVFGMVGIILVTALGALLSKVIK